jgi:diguanylate cyclase (GGDEF)-like protein
MVRSLWLPRSLGPFMTGLVDGWLFNAVQLGSALLVFIYGRRRGNERSAWTIIATGVAVWCGGNIWWSLFFPADAVILPPSIPDAFWMLSYPILFIGLAKLLRCRLGGSVARVALLDGAIAGSATSALAATFALNAILSHSPSSLKEAFFGAVYPVLDVVALGLIAGMASAAGRAVLKTLWPVIIGIGLFAVADTAYYVRAALGQEGNQGWDTLWTLGLAILAAGPLAKRPKAHSVDLRFGSMVSAVAGISSLVILVIGNFSPVGVGGVGCATLTIVLVIIRLASSFHHHQILLNAQTSEASTDALTGLANRRQFMTDLADRAIEKHPAIMVMIDLDDFKQFNDINGHLAGDQLLVRFALSASRTLGSLATLYRLGGDEFCAIIDVENERAGNADGRGESVGVEARLMIMANGEHGERIPFSYGAVSLWAETVSIHESLALSDQRLYAHKRSRKASRPTTTTPVTGADINATDINVTDINVTEPVAVSQVAQASK